MKKWFYQVILLSFICGLIVACSKDNDSDTPLYRNDTIEYDASRKILVAYFSWGGNTQHLAQTIADITGADLFRIETVNPYPTDYNECTVVAREELDNGIRPELSDTVENLDDYDVVFVGCPVCGILPLWLYGRFLKIRNMTFQTRLSYRSVPMLRPIGRKHLPKS